MTAIAWTAEGTALFLGTLDRMSDDELAGPSALPDWTGRHLVAHVHYNALALGRLTSWAATGVEARMYASSEQRAAEIERGALLPPGELRELVHSSAAELSAALDALSPDAWNATVVTAQGRDVPATEIPWMRAREVFVHSADLDAGVGFDQFPPDFLAALCADVVTKRAGAGEGPAVAAWLTGRAGPPDLGRWL